MQRHPLVKRPHPLKVLRHQKLPDVALASPLRHEQPAMARAKRMPMSTVKLRLLASLLQHRRNEFICTE